MVETYCDAVRLLTDFLERTGMPVEVDAIRREHVEAFVADLLTRNKPATASNRSRALKAFLRWVAEEGEIAESPMRNMKPPIIPETPVPVLTDDEIKRLLKACEGEESSIDETLRSCVCSSTRGYAVQSLRISSSQTLISTRASSSCSARDAAVAEATATTGATGLKPEGDIVFAKVTESVRTIALVTGHYSGRRRCTAVACLHRRVSRGRHSD